MADALSFYVLEDTLAVPWNDDGALAEEAEIVRGHNPIKSAVGKVHRITAEVKKTGGLVQRLTIPGRGSSYRFLKRS